jgi:hypothetical protein
MIRMIFACEMCDWTAEFKQGGYDLGLKVCHDHYMSHSWLRRKLNSFSNLWKRRKLKGLQTESMRLLGEECIQKK